MPDAFCAYCFKPVEPGRGKVWRNRTYCSADHAAIDTNEDVTRPIAAEPPPHPQQLRLA